MQYPLCRHIKTNGIQCQAPSLTDANHCYFHTRLYQRHNGFRQTQAAPEHPGQHIHLAPLEDRESVQVALSVVINALATGQLEPKRATALLYGLQLASFNAASLQLRPLPREIVRDVESSPDGLDLAEPGAFAEILDLHDTSADSDDDDDDDDEDEDEEAEKEQTHDYNYFKARIERA